MANNRITALTEDSITGASTFKISSQKGNKNPETK